MNFPEGVVRKQFESFSKFAFEFFVSTIFVAGRIKTRIVTHALSSHYGDVAGFTVLERVVLWFYGPTHEVELIRSRDPQVLETGDIVIDVGKKYDPTAGNFDHQQWNWRKGEGAFHESGAPCASFGLAWKIVGWLYVIAVLEEWGIRHNAVGAQRIARDILLEDVQARDSFDVFYFQSNRSDIEPSTSVGPITREMRVQAFQDIRNVARKNPDSLFVRATEEEQRRRFRRSSSDVRDYLDFRVLYLASDEFRDSVGRHAELRRIVSIPQVDVRPFLISDDRIRALENNPPSSIGIDTRGSVSRAAAAFAILRKVLRSQNALDYKFKVILSSEPDELADCDFVICDRKPEVPAKRCRSSGVPEGIVGQIWRIFQQSYVMEVVGEHAIGHSNEITMLGDLIDANFLQICDAVGTSSYPFILDNVGAPLLDPALFHIQSAEQRAALSKFRGCSPEMALTYFERTASAFEDYIDYQLITGASEPIWEARVASALQNSALQNGHELDIALSDERVLVLQHPSRSSKAPWEKFVEAQKKVCFVVFPAFDGTWRVRTLFDQLNSLPSAIWGLEGEELVAAIGISGFVSSNRGWIAGTRTLEDALELVKFALRIIDEREDFRRTA